MRPELIFCAGGNPSFAKIAVSSGFRYGVRLPDYKPYQPVWFADQEWRTPDRDGYMSALKTHRPALATVLDWERSEQLSTVLDWAEEAAAFVEKVLIIPKVMGGICHLPRSIGGKTIILAYSVPTQYAGTSVPLWEFSGWPVHLLGGSPQAQMRIAKYLDIYSADGNMSNKMAHACRFWSARPSNKGHWVQLSEVGAGDFGEHSNQEAFRRSCINIMQAWDELSI